MHKLMKLYADNKNHTLKKTASLSVHSQLEFEHWLYSNKIKKNSKEYELIWLIFKTEMLKRNCCYSQSTMANKLSVGTRTIQRLINTLKNANLITVIKFINKSDNRQCVYATTFTPHSNKRLPKNTNTVKYLNRRKINYKKLKCDGDILNQNIIKQNDLEWLNRHADKINDAIDIAEYVEILDNYGVY